MKIFTFTVLLSAAFGLQAAPLPAESIANMVAQSEYVMGAGLCAVANDTKDYGAETVTVVLPKPVGVRRILKNDYNWIRSAGYAKGKSGRYVMSERIEEACMADALSGRCVAARSYWSQQPLAVRPPGPGVATK
jgi:hypothetical protein